MQQVQLLELDQEVIQAQMESFFRVDVGDNLVDKLNVEILLRDGVVEEGEVHGLALEVELLLHGREELAGAATIVREFGLAQTADELLAARDEILEPSFATVPPCWPW
jgi:hypothetical protein